MKTWHDIDSRTSILLDAAGNPLEVRSTARDLDHALDNAAQWFGEPLECGEWGYERSDDPRSEARAFVRRSADVLKEHGL
jgi:hypothetical protein